MANVGFFARLANLWRGFLSLWISDIEKEHPEIAYENAINSMIEKYSRLKSRHRRASSAAARTSTSGSRRRPRSWPRSRPSSTPRSRPTRTTWRWS